MRTKLNISPRTTAIHTHASIVQSLKRNSFAGEGNRDPEEKKYCIFTLNMSPWEENLGKRHVPVPSPG